MVQGGLAGHQDRQKVRSSFCQQIQTAIPCLPPSSRSRPYDIRREESGFSQEERPRTRQVRRHGLWTPEKDPWLRSVA